MPKIGAATITPVQNHQSVKHQKLREIIYPKVSIKLCDGQRDPFLTMTDAKKLLGWREEGENEKFGNVYTLIDEYGKKVRCWNNMANRPFRPPNAAKIKQEVLRGNWELNLETMIIGRTGLCISCQHRLAGFILAVQEWQQNPEKWPEIVQEPTLACLIAFGADESDKVVRTVDTGDPRSLADVIYLSEHFKGSSFNDSQREQVSKMVEYAVRLLWERTGEKEDGHAPFRTHSESLIFIDNHPRLIECVKHIYTENRGNNRKISEFITLGYASALLYMMGSQDTIAEEYKASRIESVINWNKWDKAIDFWSMLATGAKPFAVLRSTLGKLAENGSPMERLAVAVKGWQCMVADVPITKDSLSLKYVIIDDAQHLDECPRIGGIDSGNLESHEGLS